MVRTFFAAIIFLSASLTVFAQKDSSAFAPVCMLPEAKKFDFLLGKWKLKWNDSLSGTKTVTKELDSCTVYENYIDDPKTGSYKANSYTIYNQWMKNYSQTMMDNKGYFMISTGEWKNDKMYFVHKFKNPEGKTQIHRQVYYNIKSDTMDWDWETSSDEGNTWKKEMTIHYTKF
jgi:hypothetical protein